MTDEDSRLSTAIRCSAIIALAANLVSAAACKPSGAGKSDASAHDSGAIHGLFAGLPPPADVAAPPSDATTTPSGLATKLLAPGTGAEHPGPNDWVEVNYTGWTADGHMFDSTASPQPGRAAGPVTLSLSRMIRGWTEGVRLMAVGEKRRLWIPADLAFKGRPGAPAGMLVFDLELLKITPGPTPPADLAAAPPDATRAPDGLASTIAQRGTGTVHPGATDGVRVNYSIWQTDGTLLDASKDAPVVRPVNGLSRGWTEALETMLVGDKRTFWVPAALAASKRSEWTPTDLTMVIELVEILAAPKAPPDVKAPPRDAIVEKDGLATKLLTKGTGTVHPTAAEGIIVQYSGWTTDGKLFDSSYTRGVPTTLPIGNLIPGWAEALQLMVEGEKRRVWVPAQLAYEGNPQGPQGMLVLEIELLKIVDTPMSRPPLGLGGAGGMRVGSPAHPQP